MSLQPTNQKNKQTKLKPFALAAFTLAETLTTLVIIGVIAATATPTIMNALPNTNKVKFKKAYSTIETVITTLINNDIIYPSSTILTGGDGVDYQQGFNNTGTIATGNGAFTPIPNKFCYYMADQLNIVGTTNCPNVDAVTSIPYTKPTFTTTDGIDWYLYIPVADTTTSTETGALAITTSAQFPLSSTMYTTKIIVDVNGSKAPNCTADLNFATYGLSQCTGNSTPDQYIIGVRYDGKLQIGCSTTPLCKPGSGVPATDVTDQGAINILYNPTSNK